MFLSSCWTLLFSFLLAVIAVGGAASYSADTVVAVLACGCSRQPC